MTGESADRHYFVFYLFFITSEIKVTQHDDDEDIVRTKANLIIIYEGIRILNPKPKPDGQGVTGHRIDLYWSPRRNIRGSKFCHVIGLFGISAVTT